jgi:hypothetical protein
MYVLLLSKCLLILLHGTLYCQWQYMLLSPGSHQSGHVNWPRVPSYRPDDSLPYQCRCSVITGIYVYHLTHPADPQSTEHPATDKRESQYAPSTPCSVNVHVNLSSLVWSREYTISDLQPVLHGNRTPYSAGIPPSFSMESWSKLRGRVISNDKLFLGWSN